LPLRFTALDPGIAFPRPEAGARRQGTTRGMTPSTSFSTKVACLVTIAHPEQSTRSEERCEPHGRVPAEEVPVKRGEAWDMHFYASCGSAPATWASAGAARPTDLEVWA